MVTSGDTATRTKPAAPWRPLRGIASAAVAATLLVPAAFFLLLLMDRGTDETVLDMLTGGLVLTVYLGLAVVPVVWIACAAVFGGLYGLFRATGLLRPVLFPLSTAVLVVALALLDRGSSPRGWGLADVLALPVLAASAALIGWVFARFAAPPAAKT